MFPDLYESVFRLYVLVISYSAPIIVLVATYHLVLITYSRNLWVDFKFDIAILMQLVAVLGIALSLVVGVFISYFLYQNYMIESSDSAGFIIIYGSYYLFPSFLAIEAFYFFVKSKVFSKFLNKFKNCRLRLGRAKDARPF